MSEKFNKKDISDYVSSRYDLKKSLCEDITQSIFTKIIHELKKGNSVSIVGFGTFEVKTYPPRISTNPQTGMTFNKGERKCVVFRKGNRLKNFDNNK